MAAVGADKELQGPAKMATASLTEVFDVCEELLGTSGAYVIWLASRDGDYDQYADDNPKVVLQPLFGCACFLRFPCFFLVFHVFTFLSN